MAAGQGDGSCPQGRGRYGTFLGKYIALAVLEQAEAADAEDGLGIGGLSYGITSWHIRKLTDNPWNGGGGYSYEQVAKMTPDQVYHRLCDEAVLKSKGGKRVAKMAASSVGVNADGLVNGVDKDGNKIALPMRVKGKSLAARLNEEAEERELAERLAKKREV